MITLSQYNIAKAESLALNGVPNNDALLDQPFTTLKKVISSLLYNICHLT
jgi:hypothetical protein